MLIRLLPTLALSIVALSVVASAASAAAVNPWRQSQPWNISHQGGEGEFPGNTMYAFKQSLKAGANMLEVDLGFTKDNKAIVQHNTTVDSRTNGTGEVGSFTLKQIQSSTTHTGSGKAPAASATTTTRLPAATSSAVLRPARRRLQRATRRATFGSRR